MKDLFDEMKKMQKRMFEEFYRGTYLTWPGIERFREKELMKFEIPFADIKEADKELIAEFDLPGIDKADIKLNVTETEIEVKAEKKHEVEEEKKDFFRQERAYQGFYRRSSLPLKVKPDQAEAEYNNGVLTVRMPKKEIEHKTPQQVDVKIK
jgi:HSP20 family protein